jgi:hypothetical protein
MSPTSVQWPDDNAAFEKQMTKRPAALVWMPEEDDQLRAAAGSGESIASISKQMNRSERAVDNRIRGLGLVWPADLNAVIGRSRNNGNWLSLPRLRIP